MFANGECMARCLHKFILELQTLKYSKMENTKNEKQCAINDVSSSTVIEPINCELSEDMKAYIEMLEWSKNAFGKYATKALMIPKEMFGSK